MVGFELLTKKKKNKTIYQNITPIFIFRIHLHYNSVQAITEKPVQVSNFIFAFVFVFIFLFTFYANIQFDKTLK